MFENLTEKLSKAVRNLRGVGTISESNITEALAEVRQALLSADVHFKVVREFIDSVKTKALGTEVLASVSPGQQIIKIINDSLVEFLGADKSELTHLRPLKIMMVGLHGAGKTTSCAKLSALLKKQGRKPCIIACDIYRPAAIDQLIALGAQNDIKIFYDKEAKNVPALAKKFLNEALDESFDTVIFDTAGRLQIDENLIEEIKLLKKECSPNEVLLVADAALGQEAVNVAKHFNDAVNLTGVVLTKLDGDARGGAALSIKYISGAPIKFIGIGEKVQDFDVFYPERMASRILGMGDVVSLVEKVQENIDLKEAERMAQKMRKTEFDLEDFLAQMRQMKKLGPLNSLMKMVPGMNNITIDDKAEAKMKQTEAIILSMTPQERRNPKILNARRRMRIANGSGTQVSQVNTLIKQFETMRKQMPLFMKMMGKMKK